MVESSVDVVVVVVRGERMTLPVELISPGAEGTPQTCSCALNCHWACVEEDGGEEVDQG